MIQNLIAFAGLSHSGKDLLYNQMLKLGKSEPDLNISQNVVYYDWLIPPLKKKDDSYIEIILPPIREKILRKLNSLIYIHDISYQRLDDVVSDFQEISSNIRTVNKHFQVFLILNRGHLIPNDVERNRIRNDLVARFQQIFPHEIPSYIVSLKGPDDQRLANMIFTQIINKASEFVEENQTEYSNEKITLEKETQQHIKSILGDKMNTLGYAGAYVLSQNHEVLLAVGKSQSWQEKVGPQIIKMLDQYGAFDIQPTEKANILRIEDFLMIIQAIKTEMKLVLIGRESAFRLASESYSTIEQICLELSDEIVTKL
ncbi:MAG: hypothetical protein JSV04_02870 [Candidatus Heimdallarchaeota archaeon]|nr:MAG: hypothetical protein JSV04_02870 [Candidatus Heimdallarchaeota archaeon]